MQEVGVKASSVITCAHGNLASNDKAEVDFALEQLKRAALLIKNLGGRQVLVGKGVGNIDFGLSRERAWENVVAVMSTYCRWCEDNNILVTLELEPEELHVCNSISSMKRFFDEIDASNLFANIDLGHLHILRTSPGGIEPVKDKVIHVHISDNNGLAHTNSVIGEGTLDVNRYLSQLIEWGIDDVAASQGEVAVAGLEIGHPGEYIADPDYRVLVSLGNVYSRVPALREEI
jgi:sugar phosphate isomerase/epimerase